jgi:hypothetical protein
MAFFAKRSVEPAAPFPPLEGEVEPPPEHVPAFAAKLLGMLGIDAKAIQDTGDKIRLMLDDYRDRLGRIEANQDVILRQLAELGDERPPPPAAHPPPRLAGRNGR